MAYIALLTCSGKVRKYQHGTYLSTFHFSKKNHRQRVSQILFHLKTLFHELKLQISFLNPGRTPFGRKVTKSERERERRKKYEEWPATPKGRFG